MKLFGRKKNDTPARAEPELIPAERSAEWSSSLPETVEPFEKELFDRLRCSVPVIDAAIMKIIRLTGGFRVVCSDERYQEMLDGFCGSVPVGLTGKSLGCFADSFLDSLLTYGSAAGEIVTDPQGKEIEGLWNGDISRIRIAAGSSPFRRSYTVAGNDGSVKKVAHPERIVYASLTGGHSLLRGLPALSSILLRIYRCIGQNYDRAGNVRYAVTYKPSGDAGDIISSRERAVQIAREWADGMNSARYGQVKDFVAVGDVDIKVIGAENQLFDTEVPVRQLLEQIVAKLSIPPFLLGLSWSSTERMSSQQADILTSELEYYRRLLTPVLCDIGESFLCSKGIIAGCSVEWDNINLQDESVLAEARLRNAQAAEIEMRLAAGK
ncbi:MAG: serine/threonine protein phosphatase [Ruminococcus sp.]|nr:serine/threonine protein phosphatase [Ruminococcus sp.]